ncbi:MAG: aldehyde dehydrogenase family protein, partial [Betaproteobacteria bacterium]|nr:aldehyde dehydrogenase family protein [Betaproteobacteria bacterium]
SFTGGVSIGKSIARKAGYRRLVLELGGNDPLIVNRAISGLDPNRRWRNFDAFDLALNHAQ